MGIFRHFPQLCFCPLDKKVLHKCKSKSHGCRCLLIDIGGNGLGIYVHLRWWLFYHGTVGGPILTCRSCWLGVAGIHNMLASNPSWCVLWYCPISGSVWHVVPELPASSWLVPGDGGAGRIPSPCTCLVLTDPIAHCTYR